MNPILNFLGLMICSNVLMTFARYAYLHELNCKSSLSVQAYRIAQLKAIQEVIVISGFAPLSVCGLKESLTKGALWVGLCLLGALSLMSEPKSA